MKRVAFHTLGCKVNQYETQAMIELFKEAGYWLVKDMDIADVYVINTCTVTNMGDRKSRQFIRRARRNNPSAIIAVVGCYSQVAPGEVEDIDEVNIILGTRHRSRIVDLVEGCGINEKINAVDNIMDTREIEDISIKDQQEQTRAFLKIQDGCNRYCSYCIIPYARGPIKSRQKSQVIKEVRRLVEKGFKEIVLTGIHVASYGKDFNNENGLLELLTAINSIDGLERIRLSSLEPTLFTDDFLQELTSIGRLCRHFHLSLQSGCDKILKKMNRKYSSVEFKEIVERIRKSYPQIALTTDIIVGFPGETREDFEETYNFVREIAFSDIHVFKYSPRRGTPAASFKNQVNGNDKQIRSKELIALGRELNKQYRAQFIGKTKEVLIETESRDHKNCMEGFTDNYLKVVMKGDASLEGQIKNVLLKTLNKGIIFGEIIQNS